ncbi:Cullin [Coprinopsis marcescibilis]|uniref:Cullin n=1 Tax=Coprinopsis marcescibilis TaxID=230819 RepID=A0A5C3L1A8_COPMA|nr:Cullin [Coprinopsis marcescibilis]
MYAQSLAKRLLCDASVSQEVEGAVVSRLAEICGEEYTGHLRRLLNEISISKDLTQDFQRTSCHRSATSNSITFDGKVVGANFWPLKVHTHPFIVPHAIAPLYEAFNRYFASRFTGRKLRWLWSHSTNEMQTNFTDRGGGKGKHTLVVSSYQAAVLVLFNVRDELWVEEVVKATGIPRDVVEQAAAPLVKAKLLSLGPRGEYCFNPGFSSKKMRLNLDNSVKYAPMSNPRTQAFKAVEGERKYATQAAVVRVLKATQKLSTRRIFERIVEGLGQKFPIRMQDVNMAIDALIEKEYIERVEGSAHEFVYIA